MLLKVSGLVKKYSRGDKEFFALDKVDLHADTQDFISITGRSGSGKSTLLNIIAGLLSPDEGSVLLEGNDYSKLDDEKLSELRNQRIGYIPQGYSVLYNLSVIDNVRLPLFIGKRNQAHPTADDAPAPEEKAMALLARIGIDHLANESPRNLSGGELKRVSIARSLINTPSVLIADEPTADLDPVTTDAIMALFHEIHRQGIAVIMATHDASIVQHGTRHIVMENGILRSA